MSVVRAVQLWVVVVVLGAATAASATPATSAPATEAPVKRVVKGVAHAIDGNKLAYTQREVERWQAGRRVQSSVTYRSADGQKIGRRVVRAHRSALMPDEVFEDFRTGMRAESRSLPGGRVEVAFRKGHGDKLERKSFKTDLPPVNGAGVVEAIRAHWGRLEAGGRVDMALIVPERLDWYHFRLRKIGTHTRGAHKTTAFVLEPDSVVLRAIAGKLHFELSNEGGGLFRYRGRVDLADGDGDPFQITVRFPNELPGHAPATPAPAAVAGPAAPPAPKTP